MSLMDDKTLKIIEEMPEEFNSVEAALSLCPDALQSAYKTIDEVALDMTDAELENVVKPTTIDRMLKIKFWEEVERSQKENRLTLKVVNIYGDVCSKKHFYAVVLKDPDRVSFLFRKPHSYTDKANELIEYALGRLRNEAMTARLIFEDSGHLDSKGAKFMLELVQYLDSRTKGSIVQKIESKSLHVNMDATSNVKEPLDLQEEIRKVRMQLEQARGVALIDGLPSKMKDVNNAEETSD